MHPGCDAPSLTQASIHVIQVLELLLLVSRSSVMSTCRLVKEWVTGTWGLLNTQPHSRSEMPEHIP